MKIAPSNGRGFAGRNCVTVADVKNMPAMGNSLLPKYDFNGMTRKQNRETKDDRRGALFKVAASDRKNGFRIARENDYMNTRM
jgi:hypothetical protein